MSEAGLTPQAAGAADQGVADTVINAGFVSKQTPLDARMGSTDRLPEGALGGGSPRAPVRDIQVEGDGPDVMMEPLRQHDPEERLRAIADAQAETEIAAARDHAAAIKNHSHRD